MTDEPHAAFEVQNPDRVQWRNPIAPPAFLESMQERGLREIAAVCSQNAIPSQVESGKGIQALLENDQTARQAFLANLAEFHARLMHHCLTLVQLYYNTARDLMIVGNFGPDYMHGFLGSHLLNQTHVRVLPGAL